MKPWKGNTSLQHRFHFSFGWSDLWIDDHLGGAEGILPIGIEHFFSENKHPMKLPHLRGRQANPIDSEHRFDHVVCKLDDFRCDFSDRRGPLSQSRVAIIQNRQLHLKFCRAWIFHFYRSQRLGLPPSQRGAPKGENEASDEKDPREVGGEALQHLSCRCPKERIAIIAPE